MKDYKAITLGAFVTAREASNGQILLFRPSDETEAGHLIQSDEIYLSRELIAKLYIEFPEEASDD